MKILRVFIVLIAILLFSFSVNARARYDGIVQKGGVIVKTSISTTFKLMETYPSATVSVYLSGTTTLASLYSNNTGTVKSNPFTADSVNASYFFYADNGFYDIKYSGTGITSPFTPIVYISLSDPNDDYNPISFGAKCDNSTNDTAAFSAINALISSSLATTKLPKGICRLNSITIPENITLDFSLSGGLYANNGQTVEHLGPEIGSKARKRFYNGLSGQGAFNFLNNNDIEEYYPQWWGAVGDNGVTDDSPAFRAMLVAFPTNGGSIVLLPRIYNIASKFIVSKSNIIWSGKGATLRYGGSTLDRIITLTGDNNIFENITFSGNNSQPLGSLIYIDDNVDNPKFNDCIFKDILVSSHGAPGGILSNQVYAVDISPYAVTNFSFKNCLFYNLISINTGNITGNGFIGGVNFAKINAGSPDSLDAGEVAQTIPTNGNMDSCTFDTIKTIINSGLSESDIAAFDDGDAIRASANSANYGYDATGVVDRIDLKVSNSRVINVSKRAIKFSGISGLTVNNLEVIADRGAYSMTEIIKLYGNSLINGLKILSPGKKVSVTRSGTTATVLATAHGFTTGDRISVFGATEQEYNGLWVITVTDANHFTYTMIPDLVNPTPSPATGTIRVAKTPRVGISMLTAQNVNISDVVMDAGGTFFEFLDTTNPSPAQRNLVVNGFAGDNLDYGGIITGTNNSTSSYNLTFTNGHLNCIGDSARAIETPATLDSYGNIRIYGVETRNGDVKVQGKNNVIDNLHMVIDRAGFNGSVNNRALFEVGINGSTNYNIYRNIHIDVEKIAATYVNATRPYIVSIGGSNTFTGQSSLRVPDTLSTAFPHVIFFGNDSIADGFTYWGNGFFGLGTAVATNGSVYRNFSRFGIGLAASVYFLHTDTNGTNLVIQNVTDMRTTASTAIDMAGGGPNNVSNVITLSSANPAIVNDSAGTVANDWKLQFPIRKENEVLVTADGVTVGTQSGTLILTAAAPHTGVILQAPTADGMILVIIAKAGTADITLTPSTTASFPAGNPRFGIGSTDTYSMTLKSSGGLWKVAAAPVIIP